MLTHPLADDDYHLVQDYLATKITFLLAKNSDHDEWEHEIRTQELTVGHEWGQRNAFLFDFTLARFLRALTMASPEATPTTPGVGQNDRFVGDFCDVVTHHPLAAEAMWRDHNGDSRGAETGARLPSTMALLMRLLRVAPASDLRAAVQHLPAELAREGGARPTRA